MYVCYEIDMPRSSLPGRKKVGTGAKIPGVKGRTVELVVPLEVMVRRKGDEESCHQPPPPSTITLVAATLRADRSE